eukprot:COSAG04_NODE_2002_length_5029_cov_5.314604_3_plen_297_part_00
MLDQHSALAADLGEPDPLEACPALQAFAARFRALPELAGYFAGPLAALPPNNKSALWGGQAPLAEAGEEDGGFVGLEEIFLKVQDVDAAVDFYHGTLGIPMERRDGDRAFLQCSSSHIVLQRDGVGRHDGGGPLVSEALSISPLLAASDKAGAAGRAQHYAFTVTEEAFDRIVETLRPDGTGDPSDPSGAGYLTRGPMGSGTNGRALFVFDPDGNEAEINTRYLCKMMMLSRSDCDRACRLANQQRYHHFRPAGVGRGRCRALSVRKPMDLFALHHSRKHSHLVVYLDGHPAPHAS